MSDPDPRCELCEVEASRARLTYHGYWLCDDCEDKCHDLFTADYEAAENVEG